MEYYAIFGKKKDDDAKDIKKAYRKLAMKVHPDQRDNRSEEEKDAIIASCEVVMKDQIEGWVSLSVPDKLDAIARFANEAWDVLENETHRKVYNDYGKEGLEQIKNGQAPGASNGRGEAAYTPESHSMSDISAEVFGKSGTNRKARPKPGGFKKRTGGFRI